MSNYLLITPVVTEPVLPESLRPEVINIEKWEQPSPRPQPVPQFYFRHVLNDLTQFDDLFPVTDVGIDSWDQPGVRLLSYPVRPTIPVMDTPIPESLFKADFLEGWYSPEIRPTRLQAKPRPLDYVEDITPFADIFRTDFVEGWYQPEIRPIQLPPRLHHMGYTEEITILSTLFREDFFESWHQPIARPVWDIRGPNKGWLSDLVQFSDLFPVVITIDNWEQPAIVPFPPLVIYHRERYNDITQFSTLFAVVPGVIALTLRTRDIALALDAARDITLSVPTRSIDLTMNTGI